MSHNDRIAIVTNVVPQYREDMYRRLFMHYGINIHLYCQASIPGMNLNLVHDKFKNNVTLVKVISLQKEKLSWQFLPVIKIFRCYDTIFFYGNPRVLSNFILATLFKLLGKRTVIWGQYHTAGANRVMEKIRLFWWSYFDYLFLYTEKEAQRYKMLYPGKKAVIGMNNGLCQGEIESAIAKTSTKCLEAWRTEHGLDDRLMILSCSRLDEKNRFDLFVDCLPDLVEKYPELLWCVIGDGSAEYMLKDMAENKHVSKHILWLGAIYDQDELAPWFMSSRLLVHPGSIGLSLMHAMGYGLPVVTHDNMDLQMPEIAALEDGVNGVLYREGCKKSLISKVSMLLDNPAMLNELSKCALKTARTEYNTEIMASNFIKINNMISE